MKHTKGNWTIADVHIDNGDIQIGSDKDYICRVYSFPDDEASREENAYQAEANAQLIAAAPELLEACVGALSLLKLEGYALDCSTLKNLQQAINKAEGN
jgi:hypothetical protein